MVWLLTPHHVLVFTGLACLAVFFHPEMAPLIAAEVLGPSPQDLGLFTSVLAAGLTEIAFLGAGGLSGLLAATLCLRVGMPATFGLMGSVGMTPAVMELARGRGGLLLQEA